MTLRIVAAAVAALALLVAAGLASAHEYRAGDLLIAHPWARATLTANQAGAIYLAVINMGTQADTLLSASTSAAEQAMLHETVMDGDVARMVHVGEIDIPADGSLVLEPGGKHLMLTGLSAPLAEGQTFTLTLQFRRAGAVEVEVHIEGMGAAPEHAHGA